VAAAVCEDEHEVEDEDNEGGGPDGEDVGVDVEVSGGYEVGDKGGEIEGDDEAFGEVAGGFAGLWAWFHGYIIACCSISGMGGSGSWNLPGLGGGFVVSSVKLGLFLEGEKTVAWVFLDHAVCW